MSDYRMRVSAKGYFFDSTGKLLLIKGKTTHQGGPFWCAPGGGVEEGESLFKAAEREVLEETGYFGKAEKVVFLQDYGHGEKSDERNLEVFIVGRIDESRDPLDEHDHEEFIFVSEDEFSRLVYLPEGVNPFQLRESQAGYKTYL